MKKKAESTRSKKFSRNVAKQIKRSLHNVYSSNGVSRMEKIGVLVVSYGAREVAMADALLRSKNYQVELYVADKQRNPFNAKKPQNTLSSQALTLKKSASSQKQTKTTLDFVLVGSEKPIIEGIRDLIEKQTGIPVICPKKHTPSKKAKLRNGCFSKKLRLKLTHASKFSTQPITKAKDVQSSCLQWLDELRQPSRR